MKNFKKTGILLLILIVPVFLYFLVHFFELNKAQPQLPYFLYSKVQKNNSIVLRDSFFNPIQDFNFSDVDGKIISNASLSKDVYLIGFFNNIDLINCINVFSKVDEVYHHDDILPYVIIVKNLNNKTINSDSRIKNHWKIIQNDSVVFQKNLKLIDDFRFYSKVENIIYLVDKSGFVRGNYKVSDRNEIRRLISEISILKNHRIDGK